MPGPTQNLPKEQRQDGPTCWRQNLAGLAALAGPTNWRFLGVTVVGLGCGRFLGEPVTLKCGLLTLGLAFGLTFDRLAVGLTRGSVALLIEEEAFAAETPPRHGRNKIERRETSLARRDPSTIPASAPFSPSSMPALV